MAIACSSGSFKGAFAHGVLNAFESAGIKADAYAAASYSEGYRITFLVYPLVLENG